MYRFIYNIIFHLALPFILLRLWWRSFAAPDYAKRIGERLGRVRFQESLNRSGGVLWIHAVSVGETVAASPLIYALQKTHPDLHIHVTTMTPTGSQRVKDLFGNSVSHSYLPYDYSGAVQRFLKILQPDILVLMETELWPNLIHYCHASNVKILLANARLSTRSAAGYQRFPSATADMLQNLNFIAAQASEDAQRLIELGAPADRVEVTGSLKFNVDSKPHSDTSDTIFTQITESGRPVVIAASTREGEEHQVLTAFQTCLQSIPDCLLVLVPRHPERFAEVANLCELAGLNLVRRSSGTAVSDSTQVFLGDSMGEMASYCSLAQVAFVGGSLVDTGCQNVLEPAALGLPVITGPSQYNFAVICNQLEQNGALITVQDHSELAGLLIELLKDSARRKAMGEAGKALVAANQQALPNILRLVESLLA